MYKILRSILFLFDPEWVHYFSMNSLKTLCKIGFLKKIICTSYKPKEIIQYSIFNIQFPNRIGLGAGFDKNAKYLDELEALGFGFVEIGTVTPLPQSGNNKPRLFRLPKDRALVNRMGFNNDGAQVVAGRLKEWRKKQLASGDVHSNPQPATHNPQLIIGGNIGKNKITPNEDAWKDYETCFLVLFEWVDYFVVNVSSPNTPGLRELQQKDALQKILSHLQKLNSRQKNTKPILLKISPDVSTDELNDIIQLAMDINLDGLIVANTTTGRDQLQTSNSRLQQAGAGGLSGRPL